MYFDTSLFKSSPVCTPAALLVLILCIPFVTQAETLREATAKMIATHPDVRAIAYNRLARNEEVRQARSGYLPTLDLVAGAGKDYVKEPFDDDLSPQLINLSLRQNIFAGLSTMNEIERQQARVRSEAYLVRSTAENTALKTASAYLEVLKSEAVQGLAQENLTIHEKIADQITLRSESGVGKKADMDQVNSRLNLARSSLINAEQNYLDAQTNYLALVGNLPQNPIKPENPDKHLPKTLEEAEQKAVNSHPTLQSATADIYARKAQDQVAQSPFMPTVDIELDQVYEDETDYSFEEKENFRALVRLRYNLFNGWKDQARKAETTLLISEAREIRNHTHRQVIESIRLSWRAYQSTMKKITYLQQRSQFATATAEAYSKQWNIGKRTLLDVLDSEAERIDSIQQLITAEYDGLYAQYRVLNGTGQLVHALELEWPQEALLEEEYKSKTEKADSKADNS